MKLHGLLHVAASQSGESAIDGGDPRQVADLIRWMKSVQAEVPPGDGPFLPAEPLHEAVRGAAKTKKTVINNRSDKDFVGVGEGAGVTSADGTPETGKETATALDTVETSPSLRFPTQSSRKDYSEVGYGWCKVQSSAPQLQTDVVVLELAFSGEVWMGEKDGLGFVGIRLESPLSKPLIESGELSREEAGATGGGSGGDPEGGVVRILD